MTLWRGTAPVDDRSHAPRGNDQGQTGKLVVDLISDNATIEFTS